MLSLQKEYLRNPVTSYIFPKPRNTARLRYGRIKRCTEQSRSVFELLLNEKKIDQETVAGMRTWSHSGFSVDNSVCIEANDHASMQRLVEYIARCPFSLARIISLTDDGKILYRASAPNCIPFPKIGDNELIAGNPRNFETCAELAEVFMSHLIFWLRLHNTFLIKASTR